MRVTFWGTRGSIAKPGPSTLIHGGNTSCVEVRTDDEVIVLDLGTGAHPLGQALVTIPPAVRRAHLLVGHPHWDHIQGIPFFGPLFVHGWDVRIYAPVSGARLGPKEMVRDLMRHPFFPIGPDAFAASVAYEPLVEGRFSIGGLAIWARYLNHPAVTLGYRLEGKDGVLVYATDHEPHLGWSAGGKSAWPHPADDAHCDWLSGADLVIHDAQYSLSEYQARTGWGHAAAEQAVDYCVRAGVSRLALFHHDPQRADGSLLDLVECCVRRAREAGSPLDVFAAREGDVIDIEGAPREMSLPCEDSRQSVDVLAESSVAVLVADPVLRAEVERALAMEQIRAESVHDAATLGDLDVDLLVTTLADAPIGALTRLGHPVVVIAEDPLDAGCCRDAFGASVLDVLVRPFKFTYLCARIQIALARAQKSRR